MDDSSVLTKEDYTLFFKIRRGMYFIIKRVFDLICSILGIILIIPITIIVKLIYVCTGDFYSIIIKQERIGKNGKPFKFYKFRSMIPHADEALKEILKDPKYKKEWDLNQKLEKDPRITKIGKLLRKTSVDELLQFINVFLNDMSLIGPRPLVRGELDAHNGNHEIYERVKPGITGWWACNGRSATTYAKRLKLEYFYVEHCSLWLDIKCIFLTFKAVITKSGAK